MTPQSAKAKGRKLQQDVRDKLIDLFELHEDDCKSTSMGAGGEDVQLSHYARLRFPYSIECKNLAKIAVYSLYQQACDNAGGHTPLLVVKQNKSKPLAILDLDDFLAVVRRATQDIGR